MNWDTIAAKFERVRTGEKLQFHGLPALSRAVASLLSTAAQGS